MTWLRDYGLVVMAIVVVFNAGIMFANYHYMRKSMATKKDMENALLTIRLHMAEQYMKKDDIAKEFQLCRTLHTNTKKPNGSLATQ